MKYNTTTSPMPARRRIQRPRGITFPEIVSPDTGLLVTNKLGKPRVRIYHYENGATRHTLLPPDTSLPDARRLRDRLYDNLKVIYKARQVKASKPPQARTTVLTPTRYIHTLPNGRFRVSIQGHCLGTADTLTEAQTMRDTWLAKNALPRLVRKEVA